MSIARPADAEEWGGSFSSLPLCVTEPGAEVRIHGIDVQSQDGTVKDLTPFIAVPVPGGATSFMSAHGRAPGFAEEFAAESRKYLEDREFVPDLGKVEIPPCGPDQGHLPQLVVVFSTGSGGGAVREWRVRYEHDGEEYETAPQLHEMVLCGTDMAADCAG